MSISNDAILAFGFSLGDSRPECLEKEDDSYENFDDMVIANLTEPQGSHEYEYNASSLEWIEHYKRANTLRGRCPAELIWFCSYEYPMYFIALKGTQKISSRGSVQHVETHTINSEQIASFKEFCDKYKIEWQEPQWYLFGMNG